VEESSRDLAAVVMFQAGRLVGADDPWEPYRLVDAGLIVTSNNRGWDKMSK
jgi:hypothetical protein